MPKNNFNHTWKVPLLLALVTIAGLLSALLGTGVWRVLSWIMLGVPVIVIIKFALKRKKLKD